MKRSVSFVNKVRSPYSSTKTLPNTRNTDYVKIFDSPIVGGLFGPLCICNKTLFKTLNVSIFLNGAVKIGKNVFPRNRKSQFIYKYYFR